MPTTNTAGTTVSQGGPTRREHLGVGTILAGAVLLAALTLAGLEPYWLLLSLGAVATVAWLVDGTGRYMGPGLMALAAGGGITIGKELGVTPYEHTLVYGGVGLSLLAISYLNPPAVRAAGAFLLYTGLTVATASWVVSYSLGWELTAVLAVWGAFWLYRFSRAGRPGADEAAGADEAGGTPPRVPAVQPSTGRGRNLERVGSR